MAADILDTLVKSYMRVILPYLIIHVYIDMHSTIHDWHKVHDNDKSSRASTFKLVFDSA